MQGFCAIPRDEHTGFPADLSLVVGFPWSDKVHT